MQVVGHKELVVGENFPPGSDRPFKSGCGGVRQRGEGLAMEALRGGGEGSSWYDALSKWGGDTSPGAAVPSGTRLSK
jgi:hypothetical protein